MTPATIERLKPLACDAYWAARTPWEESLVAILMAFLDLPDPYTGERLRGARRL